MNKRSPFRYFKTSPKIIRLAVMMYVRFPLSLRNVEDLLHERGILISHEIVIDIARYPGWWPSPFRRPASPFWVGGRGAAAGPWSVF